MKQAIVTRKLSPTNTLGVRYNAKTVSCSVTFTRGKDFPHDIPDAAEHRAVCKLMQTHMMQESGAPNSWTGDYIAGVLPNGDVCHVTK